jgi:hypothetical protein
MAGTKAAMVCGLAAMVVMALCSPLPARAAPTLCQAGETPVFACPIGHKRLSVCASKTPAHGQQYLIYRFGKPGRVELEYPADHRPPRDAFTFDYSISDEHIREASSLTLSFLWGGARYTVFREIFDATVEKEGVRVSSPKRTIELPCAAPATLNLRLLRRLFAKP